MQMKLLKPLLVLGLSAILSTQPAFSRQPAPTRQPGHDAGGLPEKMNLDDCIRLALKQNPQILEAIQQIKLTQGQIITVRAQALPHIGIGSNYNQVQPDMVGTLQFQEKTWQISFQASQLVYSGGQVDAAMKVAKLANSNSLFSLRETVNQVISTVRQQYYDVLLDRSLVEVQQESVGLLESQLKDQKSRYEAGTVPQFNVLQAEVALSNQIPVLIRARNTYQIAQLNIAKTLGVPYNIWHPGKSIINAVGELVYNERAVNKDEEVAFAKEHRPTLKIQRQNIQIQNQSIRVAQAGYLPQISVNTGWSFHNSSSSRQLDDTVDGWFFGATGNWAIFDGLATYGNVKQARAQLATAKVSYNDTLLEVELEVQQALDNLDQAKETLLSQTKNVEEALEALRLSQERLNAGAGTQLDVLNSQVQLTQARTNKLQALRDYNVALADLDRVTGADTVYTNSFVDPETKKNIPIQDKHTLATPDKK